MIWDDRQVDWTSGDGLRAAQLFERAYDERTAARAVVERVGLRWPDQADLLSVSGTWAAILAAAARDDRLLDLAAELLHDPARTVFAAKVTRLLGDSLGEANARHVVRHGLPQASESARAVVETLDPRRTANAIVPAAAGELQTINAAGEGNQEIGEALQVLLNARRRVALVRRDRTAVGTGFLVAPDLLLTNAHVVRADGPPRASDVAGMDVVFDYFNQQRTSEETGVAVDVAELVRASPATDHERAGWTQDWDAPADRLDYALLRLRRPAGDDRTPDTGTRGHYRLDTREPDLSRSARVDVFHFPLGSFLIRSWTTGGFDFNPAGTKTRLRYRTNTLPGSSGAPIVDHRGRLLAVHHFGTAQRNQAVPAWLIARAIEDLLPGDDDAGGAAPVPAAPARADLPHQVLQVLGRPVVNRAPLRDRLWEATTQTDVAHSLVIMGATESGISWSYWVLKSIEANWQAIPGLKQATPKGIRVTKIDLRQEIARPGASVREAIVRGVTRMLSNDVTEQSVAQVARQAADFRYWCEPRMRDSGIQWWVFIDSIDEVAEIARDGVDEFLSVLLDLADEPLTNLRVVFAGRQADRLEHASLKRAARDTPVGLSRDEVATWLRSRAAQRGGVVRADRLAKFLDGWFLGATTATRPGELELALPNAVEEVCG